MTRPPRLVPCALAVLLLATFVLPQPAASAELPPLEKVVEGLEAVEAPGEASFFDLWIERKEHRLLARFPSRLVGEPFLLATSITGGPYTGWQWDDHMVYWERHGDRLVLVEPQLRHKGDGTIADVVRRTYRDRVLTAVPILSAGSDGSVVIDLAGLFAGRARLFVGSVASGTDASLAKIVQAKVFSKNVEVEIALPRPGRSSGGVALHYSISHLPDTSYEPRPADDRVGYFVTAHKDFSRGAQEETTFVRWINRWHLEKADASLELSPPKEPIVFYVEKTVPVGLRRWVHEGILEWNKAFDKVGILGAIVVRQQTDTQFADLDPENVNHNFFRWITSESAFAMGPSRVHPETGQILDADIIFDEAMIRSWTAEYERLVEEGPVEEFHPSLRRYLEERPHRHPMRRWRSPRVAAEVEASARDVPPAPHAGPRPGPDHQAARSRPDPHRLRGRYCDYGAGKRHQVAFGLTVLRTLLAEANPSEKELTEEFLGQVLKEVVMHEVGHTLGLRHNFKASSWLPLETIRSTEDPGQPLSGSVMDYNPAFVSPPDASQGLWATQTLGPYDHWAIEYGYTLKKQPKELRSIAAKVGQEGLAYATDEDVGSSDPYVYRFDAGNDPLAYSRERMDLALETLSELLGKVEEGEGWQGVRQAFALLTYDYARSAWRAAEFLGGHHIRRDHKGDPDARVPVEPVDAAKQREALDLVCDRVFAGHAFRFSPELLNHLAADRWYHWGATPSDDPEYPIHDRILQIQLWTLFEFLNPRTLRLIEDTRLRAGPGAEHLGLAEVFERLTRSIWGSLSPAEDASYNDRKPFIDSIRRNLQHEYLIELIGIALEGDYGRSPRTARTLALLELRELGKRIHAVLDTAGGAIDRPSRAHLEDAARRVQAALEAPYSRDGGGASGGSILILGRPAGDGAGER